MSVEEHVCADAGELLDLMEASGAKRWIYRGQGDADWDLIPSAFRPDMRFPSTRGLLTVAEWESALRPTVSALRGEDGHVPEEFLHELAQVGLETEVLTRFFEGVDSVGLPLPEDSQLLRERLGSLGGALHDLRNATMGLTSVQEWPPLELRSILALAQHYGVPTRLLDWSRDVRVAAFFAARSALKDRTDRLAVWALDFEQVRIQNALSPAVFPGPLPYHLSLITAPAASNTRLRAQRGLFTLLRATPYFGTDEDVRLDRLAEARRPLNTIQEIALRKLVLPSSEAPNLLKLLELDWVTAASVFADYDGVAESLFDTSHGRG